MRCNMSFNILDTMFSDLKLFNSHTLLSNTALQRDGETGIEFIYIMILVWFEHSKRNTAMAFMFWRRWGLTHLAESVVLSLSAAYV